MTWEMLEWCYLNLGGRRFVEWSDRWIRGTRERLNERVELGIGI